MADFKIGDIVTVFNQTMSGKPIIEGRARIVARTEAADFYLVEFLGGHFAGSFVRFIDPLGQDDPQGYIERAQAKWNAVRVAGAA